MAKKKTEDKVVPEVIAKCDNLYEAAYSQSDIERMISFYGAWNCPTVISSS
jgi:hypothetical protein